MLAGMPPETFQELTLLLSVSSIQLNPSDLSLMIVAHAHDTPKTIPFTRLYL
jgi:hypothetical protein